MFSQLFIAAVLAVSAQATCTKNYIVQQGDYCDKISQAQNVSTYQLAVLNSDAVNSKCTNLLPGQTLCLAENADEDCATTYTVLNGDSCNSIAAANAVNTTILMLNNPQIDESCSNIYPGEVLCTSKTVAVAPVPAGGVTVAAPQTTIVVTPTATPASTPAVVGTPATAPASVSPLATAPASVSTLATAPASVGTPKAAPTVAPATPSASSDDEDCDDTGSDATPASDDDGECEDEPTSTHAPAPTATPTASSDDSDDDDDSDLPFCDEL